MSSNNNIVEQQQQPHPTARPTWLLEPQTARKYKEAGLTYFERPDEEVLRKFNLKSKGLYEREVTRIYRIRTNTDQEFLVWSEKRKFKTKLGNYDKVNVDHLGKYLVPIPNKTTRFNDQDEQEVIVKGTSEILTEYEVPFTVSNLDDLLADANRHVIEFYLKQEGKQARNIPRLDDFRNMSFDDLDRKAATPKHLLQPTDKSTPKR